MSVVDYHPNQSARGRYNRAVHTAALILAAATFPLIFMGGLVTSHGAGMSVPDWPNSWGYNMFTFPVSRWVGGIWYEHTHRLAGSVVGIIAIAVVVTVFRTDQRKTIRWTSVGLLIAVCIQGIIGGLRVVLSERDLAMVHGCAAQLFFCFAGAFCVMTSRLWTDPPEISNEKLPKFRSILLLGIVTFGVILMQLMIGAIMRHSDAGLAIPDFPTSFGGLLPPLTIDDAFRAELVHRYGVDANLAHITTFQVWIHFSHRIGACLVTACIIIWTTMILRNFRNLRMLTNPAMILLALLVTQITLGILTVLERKPADIASLHVAVGSLVLMTTCVILVRGYAVLRASQAAIPAMTAAA